jgi:hypothetical protein
LLPSKAKCSVREAFTPGGRAKRFQRALSRPIGVVAFAFITDQVVLNGHYDLLAILNAVGYNSTPATNTYCGWRAVHESSKEEVTDVGHL